MRKVNTLCLLFLFVLLSLDAATQNSRRVYITLDVSGSMDNDKYILANYTAQLISTLCDQDEVWLVIYGTARNISGINAYRNIQIAYDDLGRKWTVRDEESQIKDIEEFNRIFTRNENMAQWLFIVGDGKWSTEENSYRSIRENFKKIAIEGNVHVCYLQTGNYESERNDFTKFLEDLRIAEIHKSSTNPSSIMEKCNLVASSILGLSSTSLSQRQSGTSCIEVKPLVQCKEFIVIYQDEKQINDLPKLISVKQGNTTMALQHKGSPSTAPLLNSRAHELLSGHIWQVRSNSLLMAGLPVLFCFDKSVSRDKIKIYPVLNLQIDPGGLLLETGNGKKINAVTVGVCKENAQASVKISLSQDNGIPLSGEILQTTRVEVVSNNIAYEAHLVNGAFEATIPLSGDTTLYYSRSECPGYFTRTSDIFKIVKTNDCPPPPPPPDVIADALNMGPIRFDDLMRGDCVEGIIKDENSLSTLDPAKFDIRVSHNYPALFKKVEIKITGNKILLCIEPRGEWCDCFFPEFLELEARISPKADADFGGVVYGDRIVPIKVNIIKGSWFSRCKGIILAMILALLALIYLYFLTRKPRFKRGSLIISQYRDYYNKFDPYRFRLRKKGFSPWLDRWFNPFGSESKSIRFDQVSKTLNFSATKSRYSIKIPVASYDNRTMHYSDYDPESKMPHILIGSNNNLTIKRGIEDDGKLSVEYDMREGTKDDIPAFRTFLAVVMFALFIFISTSGILLVKSLINN